MVYTIRVARTTASFYSGDTFMTSSQTTSKMYYPLPVLAGIGGSYAESVTVAWHDDVLEEYGKLKKKKEEEKYIIHINNLILIMKIWKH